MTTIGDVYHIQAQWTYDGNGQGALSFTYQANGTDVAVGATELAGVFESDVLDPIAELMDSNSGWRAIRVYNLNNGLDYHVLTSSINGAVAGDGMPAVVRFRWKTPQLNTLQRTGWKRVPGVPEASYQGGSFTGSGTDMTAATAGLNAFLTIGTISLTPVIAARPFSVGNPPSNVRAAQNWEFDGFGQQSIYRRKRTPTNGG